MSAIPLDKNNFVLLENGQLKINHPAFSGTEGFVAFYSSWCPNCQDTKVVWSSIGYINKPNLPQIPQIPQIPPRIKEQLISRSTSIKRYPILKVVTRDGSVIDYNGSQSHRERIVSTICKKADLMCS
jgi:hypothetical protein